MTEITESKFKTWCKKFNYYNLKLNVGTATGHLINQPADFIMSIKGKMYLVECKEVEKNETFPFVRFTQKRKMSLAKKTDSKLKCYVLVYFKRLDTICLFDIKSYLKVEKSSIFKSGKSKESFNIKDIDDKFKCNWKTLHEKLK